VYPNPACNGLTIELDLDNYQGDNTNYTIMDITGKVVLSAHIELNRGFNQYNLNISHLPSGVYMLSVNNTKDHFANTRIIKSK